MIRETRQRTAIRQALVAADRPVTPEDVLGAAQRAVPGLGIATVYRTIRRLLNEGWLLSVELPGQAARVEVAGKKHHHHFHCSSCGQVFELFGCVGFQDLVPKGFRVTQHDVVLYGYCRPCQRPQNHVRRS